MNYACQIHPCQNAHQRDTAVRIAQRVAHTHASDADDLVDDILFTLSKAALEEARLSVKDGITQVTLEGRLWLSWFPAAIAQATRVPQDDADTAYSIPEAAMRFGYNEKTLRIYVKKGWLRAGTDDAGKPVITESSMRAFKDSLCPGNQHTRTANLASYQKRGYGSTHIERRRTLLDRLRRRRAVKVRRASCLSSSRSAAGVGANAQGAVGTFATKRPTFPARARALDCFGRDGLAMTGGVWGLRPARAAYPLQEMVPLQLRRALVLSRDSAVYPLAGNSGPPVHALAHSPP